jgi:SAM-dependent methyltransferase
MDQKLIKQYYDDHIVGKIKGFININERVERAWTTIVEMNKNPVNILEVGCGIGDICWRMSKEWANAYVYGVDISPKSISYAQQLFGNEKVQFQEGILNSESFKLKFDLIVLMDVYEHIAASDRKGLHDAIKYLISEDGQVVLAFPTPRHLAWLKANVPSQIQPIDEDITIETIVDLARDIEKEVLLYKEVSVWNRGDYAHVVLGTRKGWVVESDRKIPETSPSASITDLVRNKISKVKTEPDIRQKKIELVMEKLSVDLSTVESWVK